MFRILPLVVLHFMSGCTWSGFFFWRTEFEGLKSLVENADGSLILSWPAAIRGHDISYLVFQEVMPNPEKYAEGVQRLPAGEFLPRTSKSGRAIATVKEESLTLPANVAPEGQATAFYVVVKSGDKNLGESSVLLFKRTLKPRLSIRGGNVQVLPVRSLSQPLVVQLSTGTAPTSGESVWFEVSSGDVELVSQTSVTNALGQASTRVKAGQRWGPAVVVAHAKNNQSVQFTLQVKPDSIKAGESSNH